LADGLWLVLICSERKVLLFVGGWFILREKYCWLVADKPNEQGARMHPQFCTANLSYGIINYSSVILKHNLSHYTFQYPYFTRLYTPTQYSSAQIYPKQGQSPTRGACNCNAISAKSIV
jgi:hypothetical protein